MTSATARVGAAYARIEEVDRPEVWISLRDEAAALADAARVDARVAAGEQLPLAGLTVAVKDNVDVDGMDTTAACPAFAYRAQRSAPAVARLVDAGAVVLGKTNMDQFATGLVGTRSPYGAVRDARRPEYVSGGSSSGSAVAVAFGIADVAVATDTAGSGRVPAAFQGIVGIKPTRGLITTEGVVPACRTLDCVSVLARELWPARRAAGVMAAPPARPWAPAAPLAAPPDAVVAVPGELPGLSESAQEALAVAAAWVSDAGHRLVMIDIEPFLAAGRLLYEGAFVAERYAAVGQFIERHRDEVDPVVAAIILAARDVSAQALIADVERLERLRAQADAALAGIHALLLPAAPRQPLIREVEADPIAVNAELGAYTTATNLLDLCGVTVPAGTADGGAFGVTVVARAFADALAGDVAGVIAARTGAGGGPTALASPTALGTPSAVGTPTALGPPGIELFVIGAHRAGQPLNWQLAARGARRLRSALTAPEYRMDRLHTDPPKPGLVRVVDGGASIEGEVWALPPVGFAEFVAAVPEPMAIGRLRLADGSTPVGFLCEPAALQGTEDITAYGSWPAYVQTVLKLA